ncbi:hypothetical protein [Neorhizobium alkalisoli]|uniref:Uncharacterized protein n=1 Tax=Neorhizobium alkalisoli TaxID=528178 RepID=A0A561QV14_9HYPH|nr:hypothetical protein [Neorhizobium alkalisoli]TWF54185.1 hypothetical protein FHW37_10346 [Neorhizobium alkalisoli]
MSGAAAVIDATPIAYSAHQLAAMGRFPIGLSQAVEELLEIHRTIPREVRYVADVQKFILSQAAMALHYEHVLDPTAAGLTPSHLIKFLDGKPVASKNTVLAFLMEMRHYRFVDAIETSDRRSRAFRATERTEELMRIYFDIHLRALDTIDGGARHALSLADPSFVHIAQPRFARLMLLAETWWSPPKNIAAFVKSDSGSSVVHDLVSRVAGQEIGNDPINVGRVSPTEVAKRYVVSQTHTVRLFAKARSEGLISWEKNISRGDCWVSPQLVSAYRLWQAMKFSAMSEAVAYAAALRTTGRASAHIK